MRFFGLKWFGRMNPSRLLITILKYFFYFGFKFAAIFDYPYILRILRKRTDLFHIFLIYEQIHSAYSQYTNRYFPPIQRICIVKFRAKINLIQHILHKCPDSFRIFSLYEQIHSAYSQYIYSFCLFGECAQSNFEYSELNYFLHSFSWDST
jgi:hypothetical protein